MKISRESHVIVDFHTIADPIKLAYALLLYVPQYGKIMLPEHYRNIIIVRDLSRTDISQKVALVALDDFHFWKTEIGHFKEDKDVIREGNFAASIEILRLALNSGIVEFSPAPEEKKLYNAYVNFQDKGVYQPFFIEMVDLNLHRTGLGTVSPQIVDFGFFLCTCLYRIGADRLSISNPFISKSKLMKKLGIKPALESNLLWNQIRSLKCLLEKRFLIRHQMCFVF
jgi:hypothetical protein